MVRSVSEHDSFTCLLELSKVAQKATNKTEAYQQLTELARHALDSRLCTITEADTETKELKTLACASLDAQLKEEFQDKTSSMSTCVDGKTCHLDLELFLQGEVIERPELVKQHRGIANPRVIRRWGLESALCYPIRSDGRLLGYLNHFSDEVGTASNEERELLAAFADHANLIAEHFDLRDEFKQSLDVFGMTSKELIDSPEDFLQDVCDRVCKLLGVSVCIAWRHHTHRPVFQVSAATEAVDNEFRSLTLPTEFVETRFGSHAVGYLKDCQDCPSYRHSEYAKKRGWVSLLSAPLRSNDQILGMLDVYTSGHRVFRSSEIQAFGALAGQVALSIQRREDLVQREQIKQLNRIIREMTSTEELDKLLSLILERTPELVEFDRGWICRLNPATGDLDVVASKGQFNSPGLHFNRGLTGKALRTREPIRAIDVRESPWKDDYIEAWPTTRSELAVPIVHRAAAQEGKEIAYIHKLIGVLNLECDEVAKFSAADEELLSVLATQAGILIDRFEYEAKSREVARIESEMISRNDWDQIIDDVLQAVTDTLGYDQAMISLVVPEHDLIRTEYIKGIPEEQQAEFKKLASHALDENDIQASIYHNRCIEVPFPDDPRFDRIIFDKYNHAKLVRVFVPMETSDNRVIGTVEAGYYKTQWRKHIYVGDVRVVQEFVKFATRTLELRERGLLDRISHELRSPLQGIRNNIDYLLRKWRDLEASKINIKLDDTMLDCTILLHQVEKLEHHLGRPAPPLQWERTNVFRDVIIKTVNQLRQSILAEGFDPDKVRYHDRDLHRVFLFVDRARLNQAIYNLLSNSLKYAKPDPELFAIHIDVAETKDTFILRFKDWGLGVEPEWKEKIFESGFRAPEVISTSVPGSGLGLAVSRSVVELLGGTLDLARLRNPTEFHLTLPKFLKEYPTNDPPN